MPAQDGRSGRDLLAQSFSPPAFPITPEGLHGTVGVPCPRAEGTHQIEGFDRRGGRDRAQGRPDLRPPGRRRARLAGVPARPCARWPGVSDALLAMLDGVDVLIHDAQFLEGERPVAVDYGHATVAGRHQRSPQSLRRRQLVLFHHSPARTDDALDEIATWARPGPRPHRRRRPRGHDARRTSGQPSPPSAPRRSLRGSPATASAALASCPSQGYPPSYRWSPVSPRSPPFAIWRGANLHDRRPVTLDYSSRTWREIDAPHVGCRFVTTPHHAVASRSPCAPRSSPALVAARGRPRPGPGTGGHPRVGRDR